MDIAPIITDPLVGWGDVRIPPVEFRIFRAGDNITEKGIFVFDDKAAEMVMTDWRDRGIDLTIDYEHQALSDPPQAAPAAATRWVPQIRNGELWATEVKWTDRAVGYLMAGEYRYFSPAFKAEEDGGRITKILNLALTNVPAMWELMPLVAASRRETTMDPKEAARLIEELQKKVKDMETQLSAKDATITELTTKLSAVTPTEAEKRENEEATATLTQALSVAATARPKERAAAAASLAAFRGNIHKLTGATDEATALGVISAWKSDAERVQTLSATVRRMETEQLARDLEGVLDQAGREGKLTPADRDPLRKEILECTGGEVTAASVKMAKTILARRVAVSPPGGSDMPETKGSSAVIDPLQVHIRSVMGIKPAAPGAGQGK